MLYCISCLALKTLLLLSTKQTHSTIDGKQIPELVESLLVSLKHVPQVEVQVVGCEPLLQLLEVGILREAHVVCVRGGSCLGR